MGKRSEPEQDMRAVLRSREMRIFWIALPFIIVSFGVGAAFISSPLLTIVNGLILLGVAGTIFMTSYRAAATNRETVVERNELKSIIVNLDDALIVYDQNFKIRFFNPAAEKLFRVSAGDVLGRTFTPKDAEDQSVRLLAQALYPSLAPSLVPHSKTGEYPQVVDLSFEDPKLELRVATSPIGDARGELHGFMKLVRDRTRELFLLKSKTEFIAVASHQLRTPLSELKWAVEALSQDPAMAGESKTIVDHTLVSVKTLSDLVDDLLNVSRIEEGRFGYAFQEADIVEFLGKLLADAQPQIGRAGLKLYFDRPEAPLSSVTIDPQKLGMAITNLLDNAIRYNVANGEITVGVKPAKTGPFLEVSVKDTGVGIAPEALPKLFTKFFRITEATEGTGLGLYIVKNIVQSHGGQVWAESEVNRGTTFTFTLPTDPTLVPTKEVPIEE